MLRIALATLRARWVSFAGAFLALALGSGLVAVMVSALTAVSATPFPGPQRFAAAPVVVIPHQTERFSGGGSLVSLPASQPGGLPAALMRRLAGTGRVVADRTFGVQQAGGPPGQVGHAWSAASFTPYRLVAGHAPATRTEIVIGGGSPRLVNRQVLVTTAAGTSMYTISGVTAPVWFERAIFFTDTAAARISPHVDAVVAYGPPGAVRRAAGTDGVQVLTGAARKAGDPDPSGGRDQLSVVSAAAGTSAVLAVCIVVFVVAATFAFVTDQRRRELGLLRTAGATARQVQCMIITEAAICGIAASAVGSALSPLASGPVRIWMVDHGVAPAWFTIHVTARPLIIAFLIGLAAALAGAAAASWRAGRVRPAEALREADTQQKAMPVTRWLLGGGLLAAGAWAGWATIAGNPGNAMIVKDDVTAFVPIIAGFALLAPVLVRPVTRLVTWPLARLGAGSVVVRQSALTGGRRTAATAAPIVLAVGLAASMLTLEAVASAASYQAMQRQDRADFVIVPAGTTELSRQAVDAVRRVPGASVAAFASVAIDVASGTGAYIGTWDAQAVNPSALTAARKLSPVRGSLSQLGGDFLIIDERTAQADGLHAGERLRAYLPDASSVPLRIAAVIRTGVAEQAAYIPVRYARGGLPTQIDVTADPAARMAVVGAALRAAVRGHGTRVLTLGTYLDVTRSQRTAQDRQATTVILGLTLSYCLIAVANTLVMAASGRKRELTALGSAGATRRQVLRFTAAESALVVVIGAILAGGATIAVIAGQRTALTRFAGAAPLRIPWIPIGGITAACAAVAILVSVLSGWRVLHGWRIAPRHAEGLIRDAG